MLQWCSIVVIIDIECSCEGFDENILHDFFIGLQMSTSHVLDLSTNIDNYMPFIDTITCRPYGQATHT